MVLQNGTDSGNGGCSAGQELDSDPSSSTYGTCIPLPSNNIVVSCDSMCQFADFCDMVCQAWNGNYNDASYGFSDAGFGGTDNAVIDCSQQDPNNPDPSCLYALVPPAKGENCWGSDGALGNQLPFGTTDTAHEITDIFVLSAHNVSGLPAIVGWEFFTASGTWVEQKTGFADFWTTVLNSNPVTSTLLNLFSAPGSIVPLSSSQGNAVGSYLIHHQGKAASCFTHKLAV